MSPSVLKIAAVVCFIASAVLLFVAWERYDTNAQNVRAMNEMMKSSPFRPMLGGEDRMEPATPAATKYALVFAGLTLLAGIACLVVAANRRAALSAAQEPASPAE